MRTRSLALAAFALAALAPAAYGSSWKIDKAHSNASFKVRHMAVSWVRGNVSGLEGTVNLNDQDFTKSTVEATLDATSIDTDNEKRDTHLKSPDFFNTPKNPTMTFKSKSVTGTPQSFKVVGALTMNGVTKEVELTSADGITAPIKGGQGELRRGLSATTKLNRKDFNVSWNKTLDGGGLVVGDEVDVTIDLELIGDGKPSH
jgi:polyisoprenoid-binding protein YceI